MSILRCQDAFSESISGSEDDSRAWINGARGQFFNSKMSQFYAHGLVRLLSRLREVEDEITDWQRRRPSEDEARQVSEALKNTEIQCMGLELTSSKKQVLRILRMIVAPGEWSFAELRNMVAELRRRINEDLEEMVFYCVNEPSMVHRFFKDTQEEGNAKTLKFKEADELFDPLIVARWPQTTEDIIEASRCYVMGRFTASAFHLMRVVEVGILQVAKIADIQDPKASWGAILDKMAQYAYRMKYDELPVTVQPHIALIKELLPKMHAIQHAWRNSKVMHVNQKLVPVETITGPIADEMMIAVNAFMRVLAVELPTP